jgi:toxin FitB
VRYLLDTNIISELAKPEPSEALLDWMGERLDSELFISAWTVAEVHRGVLEKPAGKRKKELETWLLGPSGPEALFAGRVLVFEERAAKAWARLMSAGTKAGKPRSAVDMIIAAIAEANGCLVVTGNERHFQGVPMLNPMRAKRQ